MQGEPAWGSDKTFVHCGAPVDDREEVTGPAEQLRIAKHTFENSKNRFFGDKGIKVYRHDDSQSLAGLTNREHLVPFLGLSSSAVMVISLVSSGILAHA